MIIPLQMKRVKSWREDLKQTVQRTKTSPQKVGSALESSKKLNRVVPLQWIPGNYRELLKTFN